MVRHSLLGDFFSIFESAAPARCADAIDEYRELAMLAHAWERGSLEPGAVEGALGRVDSIEGKEPARR